jgi:hypothetical protein
MKAKRKPIEAPTLRDVDETLKQFDVHITQLRMTSSAATKMFVDQLKAQSVSISKLADELAAATERAEKSEATSEWLFRAMSEQTVTIKELAAQMRLNTEALLGAKRDVHYHVWRDDTPLPLRR